MMKKFIKLLPCIMIAVTAVLTVISYLVLPETVVTQLSLGENNTEMPKLFAVLLPCALGIGGGVAGITAGDEKRSKYLIVSAAGIAVFLIMLVVNLAA